jgi:anaphase-promoting complex subunit 2
MERYIHRRCKGNYEVKMLDHVCRWKDAVLMPWLAGLLSGPLPTDPDAMQSDNGPASAGTPAAGSAPPAVKVLREWQMRHDFSVYEIFSTIRIGEMFDIIREFPESLPAVQELRDALEITQQHKQLATSLRYSSRSHAERGCLVLVALWNIINVAAT